MGIFDQFKDTLNLIKSTFVVIGKNPSILKPTLSQIIFGAIFSVSIVLSLIIGSLIGGNIGSAFSMLGLIIFLLFILIFPFIKMYYRSAQAWIVYKTFTGEKATYQDGIDRARQNKGDIFLLGLFDIILTSLARKLKQGSNRGGILGALLSILMFFLGKVIEEGWDLINHFLLPACIIQDKTVIETVPELKNLKNNVPGALVGVFGFDFAGDLIRRYVLGFFLFLGFAIGLLFYFLFNTSAVIWFMIILSIILSSLLTVFISMVKTIYFTLMYIAITMPNKIAPEYRAEVTNYLLKKPAEELKKASETTEKKKK